MTLRKVSDAARFAHWRLVESGSRSLTSETSRRTLPDFLCRWVDDSGLLIGALGVAILTGGDKWLEARIVAILPDAWVTLTTRF